MPAATFNLLLKGTCRAVRHGPLTANPIDADFDPLWLPSTTWIPRQVQTRCDDTLNIRLSNERRMHGMDQLLLGWRHLLRPPWQDFQSTF